jgi:anti-sigma factor RsiW
MRVEQCLSEQQLRDFQFGDMPESDLADVTAHLDSCPRCESLAQQLDDQTDPMLKAIRRTVKKSVDETRIIPRFTPPSSRADTLMAKNVPAPVPACQRRFWSMLFVFALGVAFAVALKLLADAFLATSLATNPAVVCEAVADPAPVVAGNAAPSLPPAGVAWFATWESGLREAQRTGKPILLVAAAPSCAGVSGIW